MEFQVGNAKLELFKGDLTEVEADAIVNAANSTLLGGGGVDGAIHRKGGPQILEECKRLRATEWPDGLPTGCATITSGGNLKAKPVSYTHLRAHETDSYLVCRLLLEKKKNLANTIKKQN